MSLNTASDSGHAKSKKTISPKARSRVVYRITCPENQEIKGIEATQTPGNETNAHKSESGRETAELRSTLPRIDERHVRNVKSRFLKK